MQQPDGNAADERGLLCRFREHAVAGNQRCRHLTGKNGEREVPGRNAGDQSSRLRLARALASIINVLDPDTIVLGGGVSNAECLYSEGRAQIERFVFSDRLDTPIVKHTLGDSAGVFGAALLPS